MESIRKEKETIRTMFNRIAHRYDFLNHFLSLGIDRYWRVRVKNILKKELIHSPSSHILDLAVGTADLAICIAALKPEKIIGIDISEEMLKIGIHKVRKKKLDNIIELIKAEAELLPFDSQTFDAATVAFGVRNFYDLEKGLSEIFRVLKQNGLVVILEFSQPHLFPVKQLYRIYFKSILPFFGRLISGDKTAYRYLPQSVYSFPEGTNFVQMLEHAGFTDVTFKPLLFGISTIYTGKKIY